MWDPTFLLDATGSALIAKALKRLSAWVETADGHRMEAILGELHAVTVQQVILTRTVIRRLHARPAVRVGMQLQEAHYVVTADLVVMITIQILRVRV